jgi:hypothetical protein
MFRKAINAATQAYPQNAIKGKRDRTRELEGWENHHEIFV